jgi:hypothetical protein
VAFDLDEPRAGADVVSWIQVYNSHREKIPADSRSKPTELRKQMRPEINLNSSETKPVSKVLLLKSRGRIARSDPACQSLWQRGGSVWLFGLGGHRKVPAFSMGTITSLPGPLVKGRVGPIPGQSY